MPISDEECTSFLSVLAARDLRATWTHGATDADIATVTQLLPQGLASRLRAADAGTPDATRAALTAAVRACAWWYRHPGDGAPNACAVASVSGRVDGSTRAIDIACQELEMSSLSAATTVGSTSSVVLSHGDRSVPVLRLSIEPIAGGLSLAMRFQVEQLSDRAVSRCARHLMRLMDQMAEHPMAALRDLDPVGDEERRRLVVDMARGMPPEQDDPDVMVVLAQRFADSAERPAIITPDATVTYGQLEAQLRPLVSGLRRSGIGPEKMVGLLLPRSPDLLIAVLAVLEAGGAFIPIDPGYPVERRALIASLARLALMIAPPGTQSSELPPGVPVMTIDGLRAVGSERGGYDARVASDPAQAAYMICTSGSTGTPRGVVVSRRGITNLARAKWRMFEMDPGDRVLQFASPSFDGFVGDVFPTLLGGAGLVMLDRAKMTVGPELRDAITRHRVTVATMPPSALAVLPTPSAQTLRAVISAGEACSPSVVERWARHCRVFNAYGPTENTVCAAMTACAPSNSQPSIGRPIRGVQMYVLGAEMRPVPIGVTGELYIGGVGVARGYAGDPVQTALRFLPDPFSGVRGARLYRSGDLGRFGEGGLLAFEGRIDRQVKVRGHRIELDEVEMAIRRVSGVRDAAVIVEEPGSASTRLVAYAASDLSPQVVKEGVAHELPAYMVPAVFVTLAELPRTVNGKLDRRSLVGARTPGVLEPTPALIHAPNTLEAQVRVLFEEVLRVDAPDPGTDFFRAGGHSLLATQLANRLSHAFGIEIPVRVVFEHSTLGELSRTVRRFVEEASAAQVPIPRLAVDEPAPLSLEQRRMWLEAHAGGAAYNVPAALELRGVLDIPALQTTLRALVVRHDALRTRFVFEGGEVKQVVVDDVNTDVPVIALDTRDELVAALDTFGREPIDLNGAQLFRACIFRLGELHHVCAIKAHHIIVDGWSLGRIVGEMFRLYEAATLSFEAGLPAPALTYRDYALWQRSDEFRAVVDAQVAAWTERLRAPAPFAALPADRMDGGRAGGSRGRVVRMELGEETSDRLRRCADQHNASVFDVLLGAVAILVGRYTGNEVALIATPVAGRARRQLEDVVGLFVNTVPIRCDLTGDPTFATVVDRLRSEREFALQNQSAPWERLLDLASVAKGRSAGRPFPLAFVLQTNEIPDGDLPGLEATWLPCDDGTSKFDLTVAATPGRRMGLAFEYDSDLFESETIATFADRLVGLLDAACTEPNQAIRRLRVPTRDASGTRARDEGSTLISLFERQVIMRPEAVAVRSPDHAPLTYATLARRARALAGDLITAGVQPGDPVPLYGGRTPDLLVGIIGILQAGAAYVPLAPEWPMERLHDVCGDVAARHVVVMDPNRRFPADTFGQARILTEGDEGGKSSSRRMPSSTPDHPAYIIYTSGSTGRPKGVVISHANVVALLRATTEELALTNHDVWTLFHPFTFDFSVWEIWGALAHGGTLVVVPDRETKDPDAFHALLERERVTVLSQTPSSFGRLSVADARRPVSALASLRLVIFGGEMLQMGSLLGWYQRRGAERPQLVNMYGITETTVHVTRQRIRAADIEHAAQSLIGTPLAGWQVHLLDDDLQLVPDGMVGEIYVGGVGLARGYHRQLDLTAERFVPNPFGPPGSRLYRSGDRGRRATTGELVFLGRNDRQVKLRGYRIELGDVEARLSRHPAVVACFVDVCPGAGDNETGTLVAYIVSSEGTPPDVTSLRAHARRQLPDYMQPAAFVVLPQLPLNSNGKIDRARLPVPVRDDSAALARFRTPEGATEIALAEIWRAVLRLDRVGRMDDFFELGGDSIRSLEVVSRCAKAGLAISVQDVFQRPVLAELAKAVAPERGTAAHRPQPLLSERDRRRLPAGVEDAYPLSRLQAGMLLQSLADEAGHVYHNVVSWHLRVPFDELAWRSVLRAVMARHPVLRTSFDLQHYSEPLQLVWRQVELPLAVEDLRGLSVEEQEARVDAVIARERQGRFEWSRPPLVRFVVQRRSDETIQLTMVEHHAILDGWSVAALLTELFVRQETKSLAAVAPVENAMRSMVAEERRLTADLDARRFWQGRLADIRPPTLPRSPDRPAGVVVVRVPISPAMADGLRAVATGAGVSLKHVLLAAHASVAERLAGLDDPVTGVVTNARPVVEGISECLGLFLNTLPMRIWGTGGSWVDAAREARDWERDTLPVRQFPFAEIQREFGTAPLCRVAFNFLNFHIAADLSRGTHLQVIDTQTFQQTELALVSNFLLEPASKTLGLELVIDSQVFEDPAALGTAYERALQALVLAPDAPVHSTLLFEPQGDVGDAAIGPLEGDVEDTLLDLLDRQRRRTPDAVALVAADVKLTFEQLHAHAERLARLLAMRGVGAESRVGICVARSERLVIATLAALRAGAAYVPLDPTAPSGRLDAMLERAEVSAVLADAPSRAVLSARWQGLIIPAEGDGRVEASVRGAVGIRPAPSNLAYVMFTSGSTGQPKAVAVTHANTVGLLRAMRPIVGDHALQGALASTPLTFDVSVAELLVPLCFGGRILLVPDLLSAPNAPVRLISSVPSLIAELAREPGRCAAVDDVIAAGEPLRSPLVRDLAARGVRRIMNFYGPTEATVYATWFTVDPSDPSDPPIGRPLGGYRAYVLDRSLLPCCPGVTGQLYIGGVGVARGYLGGPDLTGALFLPDPYAEMPGARMYATGDLVRRAANGDLHFVGRRDQQIKLHGQRIELGEIESALRRYPPAGQVVVQLNKRAGRTELVAYVCPGQEPFSPDEMLARAAETIPATWLPHQVVVLERFPQLPNGKIDRQALPAPQAQPAVVAARRPPGDDIERQIADIWSEVLELAPPSVAADFFDIGGHSIAALRIVHLVEARLGVRLPIAGLYAPRAGRTVADMASAVRSRAAAPRRSTDAPIGAGSGGRTFFFVPTLAGVSVCYTSLARRLDASGTCHLLEAPGIFGDLESHGSIGALAARLCVDVERAAAGATSAGAADFVIVGWSFGGVVAFEMGRQLSGNGRHARVVVLDALAPPRGLAALTLAPPEMIDLALRELGLPGSEAQRISAQLDGSTESACLGDLLRLWSKDDALERRLPSRELSRLLAVTRVNVEAVRNYRPPGFRSEVLLLTVDPSLGDYGWGAYADPLKHQLVLGDHGSILTEPRVGAIAESIEAVLRRP